MSLTSNSLFTPKFNKGVNLADVIEKMRERETNPKILESLGLANAINIVITSIEGEPLNSDIQMEIPAKFDKPAPIVNKNTLKMVKSKPRSNNKSKASKKVTKKTAKHVKNRKTTNKKCNTKRCEVTNELGDDIHTKKVLPNRKVCMEVLDLCNKLSKYNKQFPN